MVFITVENSKLGPHAVNAEAIRVVKIQKFLFLYKSPTEYLERGKKSVSDDVILTGNDVIKKLIDFRIFIVMLFIMSPS